ncbi:polysaccharide export protein [Erythrobacter mangrovi]|uniref:Polysaccharide export protein n=2 Tax=Erythrobacter mangrovi TaxID=2739433 RepID=A0A7D3Y239_9SPHN|nr:polysaccharide export protein [Erythrobacter mangrovi]
MLLAGCAAIPSSGPTGAQVRSQVIDDIGNLPMKLVELRDFADLPASALPAPVFAENYTPPAPTELVGPGDVLEIALYETGVTLFGGAAGSVVAAAPSGIDPTVRSQRFPPFRVSDTGTINFPFVGEVAVNGQTTDQIEVLLRRLLRGKSQNPQVLVAISEGLTNSVIIGGDVRNPGRLVLPTNQESLSDVIALAGGNTGEIKDILVRIQREGTLGQFRMSDILAQPEQDIRIFPADRILLVRAPQSFSVLGAAGRSNQIAFPGPSLSLAEAVALAGGSNPNAGDPRAIFVFRILEGQDGVEVPTVFHLNMTEASSYILAQRFAMSDKDVLYVGNAEANQPTKLVQILSQLFYPLVTLERVLNGNN